MYTQLTKNHQLLYFLNIEERTKACMQLMKDSFSRFYDFAMSPNVYVILSTACGIGSLILFSNPFSLASAIVSSIIFIGYRAYKAQQVLSSQHHEIEEDGNTQLGDEENQLEQEKEKSPKVSEEKTITSEEKSSHSSDSLPKKMLAASLLVKATLFAVPSIISSTVYVTLFAFSKINLAGSVTSGLYNIISWSGEISHVNHAGITSQENNIQENIKPKISFLDAVLLTIKEGFSNEKSNKLIGISSSSDTHKGIEH